MARLITRRKMLTGFAAASLLAGCDTPRAVSSFLNVMLRVNEHFESLIFSPSRLAPEAPEKDLTRRPNRVNDGPHESCGLVYCATERRKRLIGAD